jgi:TRAP transporter TAXI family solute receptor
MKTLITTILMLTLTLLGSGGKAQADSTLIVIGTGGMTGVYYPTGAAIARLVNKKKDTYGIMATVELTGGSIFNIKALMAGNITFGIVQSDTQFQAFNGLSEWQEIGPQTNLRSVFSLHPEAVTLVAATDSGIRHITDLKGKKVNIGNQGSGQRQNAMDALAAVGLDYKTDMQATSFNAVEAAGLLQDKRIDAFFYTVGHPSGAILEATSGFRKVSFADITGVEELLKQAPYYTHTSIPVALYPGASNTQDVDTFGVRATLVTSATTPNDIVYALTKEVFENLAEFSQRHPALMNLTKEEMITGLSAPIHPGAMRYFREVGLIE